MSETAAQDLTIREEPCGCVRLQCSCGHSPDEIAAALGLSLDDLLCDSHRLPEAA